MDLWAFQVSALIALALATAIGYLFSRRHKSVKHALTLRSRRELQRARLMTFTEVQTDPLTGVSNRRRLDDALAAQFALITRYDAGFSLAIFGVDDFRKIDARQRHPHGDPVLRDLARLFHESVRRTDVVARSGSEQFVIVMPQTGLEDACMFSERLRAKVEQETALTVSGGVTTALDGDTKESLFARAENALESAKTAGRNCVFRHTGEQVESVVEEIFLTPE